MKAMASAKDGYKKITDLFQRELSEIKNDTDSVKERMSKFERMTAIMDDGFMATVREVKDQ